MDISSLDEKVSFENPVFTNDDAGGQDDATYTTWLSGAWARVEKISGFKNYSEGFESTVTRYDVYVRYRTLIETNLDEKNTRIIYGDKRFSIDNSELIDEKKRFYHFTVTAVN